MSGIFGDDAGDVGVRGAPERTVAGQVREPRRYKVLLHNDDYTTMEFVVMILRRIFHKSETEAMRIMLAVHKEGLGLCGIYTAEIAETKVDAVHSLAKAAGYPLRASLEEV